MLDSNAMSWLPSKLKFLGAASTFQWFSHGHVRLLQMRRVFVGDVVLLKDPEKSDNFLVRRLAAIEGYEMASTDEKDEPFVLDEDECWVLADNEKVKPKEANDSRTFGPISMSNIVGRVIYCLQTAVDHGPVQNSHYSMRKDSPVLEVELDVEELAKNHKA
ncbi:unnamed protein product [Dovyalis caffra]|uniref:Mitochondrial inner membrane protease subunit 2 n=1 Tax=Dovyalis caffra TaxID=77055 RepID=A0AAV1S7M2_9ROSI|nr:unnamed protein product [Dovyalis caffra]